MNSKKPKTIDKLVEDGRVIAGSENIANTFNNYFKDISRITNGIPVLNTSHRNYKMKRSVDAFNFEQATSVKIKQVILNLSNKGCNIHCVPNCLFKFARDIYAHITCDLIN